MSIKEILIEQYFVMYTAITLRDLPLKLR